MTRSPSTEPCKPSTKRKGTRSVSTLSPAQLARKRANDREAQRAIRARTKEHIERLERELDEFRSQQDRDETVRELVKRNRALEKELHALRESIGITGHSSHSYGSHVYEDNLSMQSPVDISNRASPFQQQGPDYHRVPEYGASYIPTSDPSSEAWSSNLPVSIPSSVSSPSSSGNADDYGYVTSNLPPTSMAGTSVPSHSMPLSYIKGEVEYEDIESDTGYSPTHTVPLTPMFAHHHSGPFNMYPVYYPQSSPAL